VMMALDLNQDGELDAGEIAKAPESLRTLDKNGDGKLSGPEHRPGRPGQGGPGVPGEEPPGPRSEE
jgi:hypothetical protein